MYYGELVMSKGLFIFNFFYDVKKMQVRIMKVVLVIKKLFNEINQQDKRSIL